MEAYTRFESGNFARAGRKVGPLFPRIRTKRIIYGRILLSLSVYVNIREIAHSRNALFETSRLIKRLIKLLFREN